MSWKLYERGTTAIFADQGNDKFMILDNQTGETKFEMPLWSAALVVVMSVVVFLSTMTSGPAPRKK